MWPAVALCRKTWKIYVIRFHIGPTTNTNVASYHLDYVRNYFWVNKSPISYVGNQQYLLQAF